MSRAKGVKLNLIVGHSPSPDWQQRIARAFDVILENAPRRRVETEEAKTITTTGGETVVTKRSING